MDRAAREWGERRDGMRWQDLWRGRFWIRKQLLPFTEPNEDMQIDGHKRLEIFGEHRMLENRWRHILMDQASIGTSKCILTCDEIQWQRTERRVREEPRREEEAKEEEEKWERDRKSSAEDPVRRAGGGGGKRRSVTGKHRCVGDKMDVVDAGEPV
jgi:hypothetical protein